LTISWRKQKGYQSYGCTSNLIVFLEHLSLTKERVRRDDELKLKKETLFLDGDCLWNVFLKYFLFKNI
jgi:hypothetical protein